MGEKSTLERAFELARSGSYTGVAEISRRLTTEGYPGVHAHLSGSAIKSQLLAICTAARANRSEVSISLKLG